MYCRIYFNSKIVLDVLHMYICIPTKKDLQKKCIFMSVSVVLPRKPIWNKYCVGKNFSEQHR